MLYAQTEQAYLKTHPTDTDLAVKYNADVDALNRNSIFTVGLALTSIGLLAGGSTSTITLAVSDSGPGIPAEEHARVFQRFYRLERSHSTPGNGLGLSLVEAIAALHEVSIEVTDNGPGLRVILRFRRITDRPPLNRQLAEARRRQPEISGSPRMYLPRQNNSVGLCV